MSIRLELLSIGNPLYAPSLHVISSKYLLTNTKKKLMRVSRFLFRRLK